MPSAVKVKAHLFSGFLGTGKTTAIMQLMAQKNPAEKWLIVVNEFGEIGIDGAVLSENGIPVAEISGGCLCCTSGAQMGETLKKMLASQALDRVLIEASGLAHAGGVIDELQAKDLHDQIEVGTVFTLIDPRQFVDENYKRMPLYRDQVGVCDVLVASKTDLCDEQTLKQFREQASLLFPPKLKIVEVGGARIDMAWLDLPVAEKPRYRIKALSDNAMGFQSQGYSFPAGQNFDIERLSKFFDDLPKFTTGLVRAKGVFQIMDTWAWLNWVDGHWGANQVAWRRDSRFELIAQAFDADEIEKRLNQAME